MPFIEAPTTFYLGRRYDVAAQKLTDEVVYYDARNLVTHAIVLGMTGSGKTGLCITMLEEAILDNIPAIIIDPKGDITNLLLTFPDFRAEDFEPWVNVDDARREGMDIPQYAETIAGRWKNGLADWGIVPDRLRWLKSIASYHIYTPGSDAGLPVSILASLAAPREGWAGNEESLREQINGVVTALLGLIGMDAQAVRDKEHVLISTIFEHNWQRGIDLTLEDIIMQVQQPPFAKLGVLDVEQYMPEKARYKLAMALNSIVAAPSFVSWIRGEPLDIQSLLYQPNGRAKVSIFYIAHLSEPERQFIITLLLEKIRSWLRGQSGTTSLRALLYIDEMYGYFPPYPRNPPTKDPILRLIKQARAFGLGLILATQNPGDLDYKGLTNAGTWFIGRLQSEVDKAKVLAGLESLVTAEDQLNLKDIDRLISDVRPRVFLMHNIHDPNGPQLLHTRWTMSYLRGPLTRQQVTLLMADQRQELAARLGTAAQGPAYTALGVGGGVTPPPAPPGFAAPPSLPDLPPAPPSQPITAAPNPEQGTGGTGPRVPAALNGYTGAQPALPSAVAQYFLPARLDGQQAVNGWSQQTRTMIASMGQMALTYRPVLLAQAAMRYQDRKSQVHAQRVYAFHVPEIDRGGIMRWDDYQVPAINPREVANGPAGPAFYGEIPVGMSDAKRMAALRSELVDTLYTTARLQLLYSPTLGVFSNPDQPESEYHARLQQIAREKRDADIDALTEKFGRRIDQVDDRIRREERELSAEKKQVSDLKREEMFTRGEALLSLFKGRTAYTMSRVSRVSRYRRQAEEGLTESVDSLGELDLAKQKLQEEFQRQIEIINDKWAQIATEAQPYPIQPFKKDIQIELFGIGWIPHYYVEINGQPLLLQAYA